jgi:hypothetical protein
MQYKNKKGDEYYLHNKTIVLKGSGKNQTIYFFSKTQGDSEVEELPQGFKVIESTRTGLPILKRA